MQAAVTVPWTPPQVTPEQADALWRQGELLWKLHLGQMELEYACLTSVGKLFVADCSRQLGKSTWGAKKCVEKALKKPGARIRYATAFLTDLEQFIIPAFDLVLEDCPDNLKPIWRAQKSEYYFPHNKSRIRLVGLDRKPNGLRGNRLDLVVLDEAGYVTRLKYIYQFVLIPATTHVPDAQIIMMSTQPETPDHDFVFFCDKAEAEGGYVKLTIFQNPMLSKDRIEDIAIEFAPPDPKFSRAQKIAIGMATTAFRREYLCERVVEEDRAIIPDFNETRHVVESPRCPAWKFWHRIEALDSGVRDKTVTLFGYYDFARAKLVVEGEFDIRGPQVTTRNIANLTRKVEMELGGYALNVEVPDKKDPTKTNWECRENYVYRRTADNDNIILIQDLGAEFDLHFSPTSKDDLAAMVNQVRLWFSSGRIEIHPRCRGLIGSLKAGIWNLQRTEFSRSDFHGHFDHIAALVYMVRNCPVHENPVPQFFNQNLSDVVFTGLQSHNGAAAVLKKAFSK